MLRHVAFWDVLPLCGVLLFSEVLPFCGVLPFCEVLLFCDVLPFCSGSGSVAIEQGDKL